jgi:pimeloyl-ACP methyl ester carboxylesterase
MNMAMNMPGPRVTPSWTDAGPAQARDAVVFLHGIGGGRHGWATQQAHVARLGWRSLAWDMPGYGDSPMVSPYDFAQLAQSLLRMLDAAQVQRAVLVGHSMGAMVALQAWTQTPGRITAMVLAASSPAFGHADGDFQQQFLAQRLAPLDAGRTMGDIADKLIPAMSAPGGDAAKLYPAYQSMSVVPPETYRAALQALVQFEQRAALPTLTVPVLCLAAEHDRMAPPAVMARMAQKIPGARCTCLAAAGHLLHLEQPEAFNDALAHFLKDLKP